MAAIELKNVVKRYGHGKHELQVIHGVNAQIAAGAIHTGDPVRILPSGTTSTVAPRSPFATSSSATASARKPTP